MTPFQIWQSRWSIPQAAIDELMLICDPPSITQPMPGNSEQSVQTNLRMLASQAGGRLWRNNVGTGTSRDGNFIRFGLCNSSSAENKRLKSSDLIGIRPVTITQAMVGSIIGQFIAREVKRADWQWSGSDREQAQANYLNLVNSLGGDGRFSTGGLW